jgi:imidazole glycerol phosphate synthase subunit HisF
LQTIEVGEKSLLHCIDEDGTNSDFDLEFVKHLGGNVSIPLFVSSGTGKVEHFSKVFEKTNVEASLAVLTRPSLDIFNFVNMGNCSVTERVCTFMELIIC